MTYKYRIFIINTDYPDYINSVYTSNPHLKDKSFSEQYNYRMETLFETADLYSNNLIKLEHEVINTIANRTNPETMAVENVAVPDVFHPDSAYIEAVRPGGTGVGAEDHKVLYNYKTLTELLKNTGFEVELLEYWDENGKFHFKDWSSEYGHVQRSKRYDKRNQDGTLTYTSLIVDAIKPKLH